MPDAHRIPLPAYPRNVIFTITNKCNQRCLFCSGIYSAQTAVYANPDAFKLPWLAYAESITLVGAGEALCHPDYTTILENIHSVAPNVPVILYTNGVGLHGSVLDVTLRRVTRIDISQNSIVPDNYARIIKGNYQQSIENLQELSRKNRKVHVQLMMVCLKQNQDEIKKFILFAHKMHFHSVKVMLGFYPGHDGLPLDSYLENLDHIDLVELSRLAKECGVGFTTNLAYRDALAKEPCFAPWNELRLIAVPGGWHVNVCCRGALQIFMKDQSLQNIQQFWNHERLEFIRRTVNSEKILANKMCLRCRMRIQDEKFFSQDENFALMREKMKIHQDFEEIWI